MTKIYTHYSDSHKALYEEFFKPSLRNLYSKNDVTIKVLKHEQTTADGLFMSQGWLDSMNFKLDVILTAVEENENNWFIFADCDVQFFKPFVHELEYEIKDVDFICQEDCESLCAGFFACKSNENTKKLFLTIKKTFRDLVNDQVALNEYKNFVNYKLLDREKYFTIGNFFQNSDGTHNWDNKTNINPPSNMLVHHANYVKGVENKIKLLQMIRENHDKSRKI